MKKPISLICGIAIGISCGVLSSAETNQDDARTITRPNGTSIRALLKPTDKLVVVTEISGPPLEIKFANDQERAQYELDILSNQQTAVLLARVNNVASRFDQGESWISSEITFDLIEVVKQGTVPIYGNWGNATIDTVSRRLTLNQDGGELLIGTTVVSAGDFALWEVGRTYLLSLAFVSEPRQAALGVVYRIGTNQELESQLRSRGSRTRSLRGLRGRLLIEILNPLRVPGRK